MTDWKSCFTCRHQRIIETSDEWIENFCKLKDGKVKNSPYSTCDKWQPCEVDTGTDAYKEAVEK